MATDPKNCQQTGLPYIEVDGHRRYLATLPMTTESRTMLAAKPFEGEILPRSEWETFGAPGDDFCKKFVAIKDQDGEPACMGHGAASGLEIARNLAGCLPIKLSAWFCYATINGGRNAGANVGDSLDSLKRNGCCSEDKMPYGEWRPNRITADARTEAARFKVKDAIYCPTPDHVVTELKRGRPVVGGIDIGNAFEPDSQGFIPHQRGGGGGHATCYVPLFLAKQGGDYYVLDANSWGTRWGKFGFGWLPIDSYVANSGDYDHYAIEIVADDPQEPLPPGV